MTTPSWILTTAVRDEEEKWTFTSQPYSHMEHFILQQIFIKEKPIMNVSFSRLTQYDRRIGLQDHL